VCALLTTQRLQHARIGHRCATAGAATSTTLAGACAQAIVRLWQQHSAPLCTCQRSVCWCLTWQPCFSCVSQRGPAHLFCVLCVGQARVLSVCISFECSRSFSLSLCGCEWSARQKVASVSLCV
jgi:hypothetical protein